MDDSNSYDIDNVNRVKDDEFLGRDTEGAILVEKFIIFSLLSFMAKNNHVFSSYRWPYHGRYRPLKIVL